jgi:hypothetical protein
MLPRVHQNRPGLSFVVKIYLPDDAELILGQFVDVQTETILRFCIRLVMIMEEQSSPTPYAKQ